ncbi:MAG: YveK family protein, partial [Sarcina sp.]
MENKDLTLNDSLYILKKKYKLVIVITVLFTVLSILASVFLLKPKYEATATLFIGKNENIQDKYSVGDLNSSYGMMYTYMSIAKTNDFITSTLGKNGINKDATDVLEDLQVISVQQNAPILQFKYVSSNKDEALKIVTALSKEFDGEIREIILNTYTKVIDTPKIEEITINKVFVILTGFILGL